MLDLLNIIPAVVRILIIFALILLIIKRRWSLGNAFLAGAAGLGLIFGMRPLAIGQASLNALLDPKTLSLSIVVSLILILSHCLEKTGQMERVLARFRGLLPWASVNLVIFPALIGLLPMPGGAIFSAPMVKAIGGSHGLLPSQLSYVNYWFRHIWEYWWPLYPGILLTTALAEVDLWQLVFLTMPLTIVAIFAGYWPLRGVISGKRDNTTEKELGLFIKEAWPILMAILGGLGFGQLFSVYLSGYLPGIDKELGLILALVLSIAWVYGQNRMQANDLRHIIFQPALLKMVYMVSAILVFKGILEASGAVDQISSEMLKWRIPLMPITVVLPLLVGIVSGITIAFVGATFPILISLIHNLDQGVLLLPYLMLALGSGFVGVLISPLHLCLLLSNQYFETSLMSVYRQMRFPIGVLFLTTVIYFALLSALMI